ncbi:hypothetical protein PUN28_003182 [Cardiocondyla obscurior]|uniref:Uncharacterized protein n=1 Tax=Cardiocondyla obscurior TaxID=286306 RepID=A0AAW2GMR9_9HYME
MGDSLMGGWIATTAHFARRVYLEEMARYVSPVAIFFLRNIYRFSPILRCRDAPRHTETGVKRLHFTLSLKPAILRNYSCSRPSMRFKCDKCTYLRKSRGWILNKTIFYAILMFTRGSKVVALGARVFAINSILLLFKNKDFQ